MSPNGLIAVPIPEHRYMADVLARTAHSLAIASPPHTTRTTTLITRALL